MTKSRTIGTGLFCLVLLAVFSLFAFFAFDIQSGSASRAPDQSSLSEQPGLPAGGTASPTACLGDTGGPWHQVLTLPVARHSTTGTSDGTYYYVLGGSSSPALAYRYDPVSNSWSSIANMAQPAASASAFYYAGKIYVFGGDDNRTTRIYDIASNSWSLGAPMPEGRSNMAGGIHDDKINLVSGYHASTPMLQNWEYDITADTWITKTGLSLGRYAATSIVVGQYLYLYGGTTPSDNYSTDALRYDISNDTWTTLATFPYQITGAGSSVVGSRIWIYGGFGSNGEVATTRIYDPATNSYSGGPNMNSPRAYFAGGNLGSRSIAVGANTDNNNWREAEISDITFGPCPTDTPAPPTVTPTNTATPTQTETPTVTLTPTASCDNRWGEYPLGSVAQVQIVPAAIGVVSADDIWGVTTYYNQSTDAEETWTMHWDGVSWSRIASPNPGTYGSRLSSISVISSSDIWAVGQTDDSFPSTVTLHWDGTQWSAIESPGHAYLTGVAGISANDVWAVGYSIVNNNTTTTFTMHWNGAQWSIVSSPNPNQTPDFSINRLNSVAAASSNEVYAVGGGWSVDGQQPFALRWNGSVWSVITIPTSSNTGELKSVTLTPGGDILAVGVQSEPAAALIVKNWVEVLEHPSEPRGITLRSLWAFSDNDIWAVGDYSQDYQYALSWHWNGTEWSSVQTSPSQQASSLMGVGGAAPGQLWAIGSEGIPTHMLLMQYPDPACASPSPTATPPSCAIEYQDVPSGSTFYPYVHCLACQQIISGYPCGNPEPCMPPANEPYYRVNNNVTRGQIAKIVSNAAGFNDAVSEQHFQDVVPGSTFYDFIERLFSRSVMSGYACGGASEPCVPPGSLPYFRPNAPATRGQLAKITSNAAGFYDPYNNQLYEDVPLDHPFAIYIARLTVHNAIGGYLCGNPEPCVPPDNRPYFRPSNNVTRGQTSKIVSSAFFPECNPPNPLKDK